MLVDEPEGSDNSYDGKDSRYNPSHIMRCDGRQIGEPSCDKDKPNRTTVTTHPEIRGCRAETVEAPSGVPLAQSKSHFPTCAIGMRKLGGQRRVQDKKRYRKVRSLGVVKVK